MTTFFPPERLETDRFVIRCWMPGDGPALRDASLASYEHLRPWLSWAVREEPEDVNEERVRRFRARWLLNEDYVLSIWDPEGARVLGGSGFHLRDGFGWQDGVAEIGMWISGDAAGRGLGTDVLRALLGWGFDAWGWERLEWRCDVRNVASRRVAEKAGMLLEGTLRGEPAQVGEGRRDTLVFGLTRDAVAAGDR